MIGRWFILPIITFMIVLFWGVATTVLEVITGQAEWNAWTIGLALWLAAFACAAADRILQRVFAARIEHNGAGLYALTGQCLSWAAGLLATAAVVSLGTEFFA